MLNFSFNLNVLLGIITSFGFVILYFLRTIKPKLARDEDILFSTLGLLYSFILIAHGWRLDSILTFSQILIVIILLVTGWENIRLRGLISSGLQSNSQKQK